MQSSGSTLAEINQNASQWQSLTNKKFIQAYGQSCVSSRSELMAISSKLNASDPLRVVGANISIAVVTASSGESCWWLCSAY